MPGSLIFSLAALAALVPATVSALRAGGQRDALFWLLLAVAIAGPLAWVWTQFAEGWRTGFAPALWTTMVTTLAVFAAVAATSREGWRLAALLFPYLLLIGLGALVWQDRPERELVAGGPTAWIGVHIAFSLLTYATLTLCAIAGLAAFLQERAIKAKRPDGGLARLLPSLSAAETLELKLLGLTTGILALGVTTGMAVEYLESGRLMALGHKTLFSLATLAVLALLLLARRVSGMRGRRAARIVLLAYLLLTLGYPGVKFVTDVIVT
ncbi:MAG: hypothetical protein GEU92_00245 [Alphaproteobacteria bacterium]|nr:hypothetical protein [Alphaproteobacteria bacterium]